MRSLVQTMIFSGLCIGSFGSFAVEDPTVPALFQAKQIRSTGGDYELQAILDSPGRKIAVINSALLAEGELIGNARLVEIHPNYVVIDVGSGITQELFIVTTNLAINLATDVATNIGQPNGTVHD